MASFTPITADGGIGRVALMQRTGVQIRANARAFAMRKTIGVKSSRFVSIVQEAELFDAATGA